MLNRDDGSRRWPEAREAEDLEASIAGLTARIRAVTQLVRAITPVVNELQALQEVAAQLRSIDLKGFQQAFAEVPAPPEPPAIGAIASGAPPLPLLTALPSRSDQVPTLSRTPLSGGGAVQVTIARLNGPLEPVRIRRGLASLSGVRDVALVKRDQSRLTVTLDTDQAPHQLPISEALAVVFDQEVTGEWTSEGEFLAVIEGASEAPGHT
jgi:hypothetical protein